MPEGQTGKPIVMQDRRDASQIGQPVWTAASQREEQGARGQQQRLVIQPGGFPPAASLRNSRRA